MASDRSCCYVLTGMRIDSDSDARACAEGAVEKRIDWNNLDNSLFVKAAEAQEPAHYFKRALLRAAKP